MRDELRNTLTSKYCIYAGLDSCRCFTTEPNSFCVSHFQDTQTYVYRPYVKYTYKYAYMCKYGQYTNTYTCKYMAYVHICIYVHMWLTYIHVYMYI